MPIYVAFLRSWFLCRFTLPSRVLALRLLFVTYFVFLLRLRDSDFYGSRPHPQGVGSPQRSGFDTNFCTDLDFSARWDIKIAKDDVIQALFQPKASNSSAEGLVVEATSTLAVALVMYKNPSGFAHLYRLSFVALATLDCLSWASSPGWLWWGP